MRPPYLNISALFLLIVAGCEDSPNAEPTLIDTDPPLEDSAPQETSPTDSVPDEPETTASVALFQLSVSTYGDQADVFYPTGSSADPLPTLVFLQGANVERTHYREVASRLASKGYLVVVPDHERSVFLINGLYPQVGVIDACLQAVAIESESSDSRIFGKYDPELSGVVGHSLGGVATLEAAGSECSSLLCSGSSYSPPTSVKAVATYGTNRKPPGFGAIPATTTDGISVLLIQGTEDGTISFQDTQTTWTKIEGGQKTLMLVDGGNHYSITNTQNPPGAIPDFSAAYLDQEDGLVLLSDWLAHFFDATIKGDESAQLWFTDGTTTPEAGVTLTTQLDP